MPDRSCGWSIGRLDSTCVLTVKSSDGYDRGVHEKRIEIRWRDIDAFRHVNNAVYATYLEECRDELAEHVLAGSAIPGTTSSHGSRSTTAAS